MNNDWNLVNYIDRIVWCDSNLNKNESKLLNTSSLISAFILSGVLQYVSYNWSEIITEIWVFGTGYQSLKVIYGENINWSLIPSYPNCQYIDLVDYIDFRTFTPFKVHFYIGKLNFEISLSIEDRRKVVERTLDSNILAYDGQLLKITNASYGQAVRVTLS